MSATQNASLTESHVVQAESLWQAAINLGLPVAVWRLPNHKVMKVLISLVEGVQVRVPDLEELPACFVLHPFEHLPDGRVYTLDGDLIFTINEEGRVEEYLNKIGEDHPFVQKYLDEVGQVAAEASNELGDGATELYYREENGEQQEHYQAIVTKAIDEIKRGHFTKIVLSRTKSFSLSTSFQPYVAFKKLSDKYRQAFVSLVHLPDRQESWLGASPEVLVNIDTEGIFRTAALAGTQPADQESVLASDIRWGQKEIHEQALVCRYIVECFKKIRLREYSERGPKTVRAGNLFHLRTDFEVNTHHVNFPELGTVMLKLLHPTSAVCGTPREPAFHFIKSVEKYDRSLYSGFLGPVNIDQETSLFVNLRTMRLSGEHATLFAGAGITEDSNAAKEWIETEMKCDTLLQVLT